MGYSPQGRKKSDTTEQLHFTSPTPVFLGFPCGSAGKESTCSAGDLGSIAGSEKSPAEGNGYPLQYSCLENSMERGPWQAIVHGVIKESDMT